MHAYEMHAYEVHACEMHVSACTPMRGTPMRGLPPYMHSYDLHDLNEMDELVFYLPE
jgi:hypothetical protein